VVGSASCETQELVPAESADCTTSSSHDTADSEVLPTPDNSMSKHFINIWFPPKYRINSNIFLMQRTATSLF